jgi:predicted secreted protein
MPTFRHGKNAIFKITDSGATLRDISNVVKEVTLPRSIETGETTSFGSGAKTYVTGLSDATISVSGTFDATVDGYLAGLIGSDATAFEYGPEGSTSTRIKFTGSAILTKYEIGAPVGDVVTFSAEFQVSGAITRTTY